MDDKSFSLNQEPSLLPLRFFSLFFTELFVIWIDFSPLFKDSILYDSSCESRHKSERKELPSANFNKMCDVNNKT